MPISTGATSTHIGPRLGFCDASTSTTPEWLNLSQWAGSYVVITVETVAHYVSFGAATGFLLVVGNTSLGSDAVAYPVAVGEKAYFVVHPSYPWLAYRTTTDNGLIRVHKA